MPTCECGKEMELINGSYVCPDWLHCGEAIPAAEYDREQAGDRALHVARDEGKR